MPYHVTIATHGRATLFVGDPLAGARLIARVGGARLELFAVVDDHVHLVVRDEPGVVASAVSRAISATGATMQHAFTRSVDGRSHHPTLVGYLCRQVVKHGLREHPALYAGTCAPDLLGIRRLANFDPGLISESLPRLDLRAEVARACGVPTVQPATDAQIATRGASALWATACAAGGIAGIERDYHAVAVRRAFASLARSATVQEISALTGLSARMVPRLRDARPDPRLVEAIRRRVALEASLDKVGGMRIHAPEFDHERGEFRTK